MIIGILNTIYIYIYIYMLDSIIVVNYTIPQIVKRVEILKLEV